MFVKLELIAQVHDPKRPRLYTYYFFSKKHNILLPIETFNKPDEINTMAMTLLSVLNSFCITIKRVIIYLHRENKYYTYLSLGNRTDSYEFNCDLFDILDIYHKTLYPIYIKKDLLTENGIKITKRMLLKAFSEDVYQI